MTFALRLLTSASIIKYVDPSVDDYCVRAITQGDHRGCHHESRCHKPGYIPMRQLLSNPAAIKALEGALKKTSIYRFADHYCRVRQPFLMLSVPSCASSSVIQCRDTYWIESFNHQLLTYLPKRIHFGNDTFVMRMNLAVLDWVSSGDKKHSLYLSLCVQNENVQRAATSHRLYLNSRRPDHRAPSRVLVPKTFKFVQDIWMPL